MKNGPYVLIDAPLDYPGKRYRGRYCYEHHYVWWKNTGTLVPLGFIVHHRDENKHNNIFDNLELKSNSLHVRDHNLENFVWEDFLHGTYTGYQRRKCRCELCKQYKVQSMRKYRANVPR